MSLGTTAVYSDFPNMKNKPPWKQDVSTTNKPKHLNYKGKSNKIPLRDKIYKEEMDKELQKHEREAQRRANKMLAERQKRERQEKERQKLTNQNASGDYVTLTKEQLQAIFDSLNQVQSGPKKTHLNVEVDDPAHLKLTIDESVSSELASRDSHQSDVSSQQLETVLNLAKKVKSSDQVLERQTSSDKHSNESARVHPARPTQNQREHRSKTKKQVVLNFDLSGKAATDPQKRQQSKSRGRNNKDQVDDDSPVFVRQPVKTVVIDEPQANKKVQFAPNLSTNTENAGDSQKPLPESAGDAIATKESSTHPPVEALSPRQQLLLIPRSHLTKAERKRLELELENAALEKIRREKLVKLSISPSTEGKTAKLSSISKPEDQPSKQPTQMESDQIVEPDFIPGLGDVQCTSSKPSEQTAPPKRTEKTASQKPTEHTVPPKLIEHIVSPNVKPASSQQPPQNLMREPSQDPVKFPQPLTKAQLKRLQWDMERASALPDYNPWGKPGPGVGPVLGGGQLVLSPDKAAPSQPGIELLGYKREAGFQEPTTGVPTSLLGLENSPRILATNTEQLKSSLSKAEMLKIKWAEERAQPTEDYNPFGRPGAGAPIRTASGTILTNYNSNLRNKNNRSLSPERVQLSKVPEENIQKSTLNSTAPVPRLDFSEPGATDQKEQTEDAFRNHGRGQIVNMDPITLREKEEQRKRELQYQEDIRRQVEEKQRLKREEQLRKKKEEADEEEKWRKENNKHVKQTESVRLQHQQRQAKDVSRVDLVAEAMQRAKQEAELLKARKRLEKLQAAGHDITHLKAAYEEKFSPRVGPIVSQILTPRAGENMNTLPADVLTPRTNNAMASGESVPSLELSSHHLEVEAGNTARTVSHRTARGRQEHQPISNMKELGVQTDNLPTTHRSVHDNRQQTTAADSSNQVRKPTKKQQQSNNELKSKKPTSKPSEAKPWGWKNQGGKQFTEQSKRDPFYLTRQQEKQERINARKEQLLKQSKRPEPVKNKQVEANKNRFPVGNSKAKSTASNKELEAVNSYLSPRHQLNNQLSPRLTQNTAVPPANDISTHRTQTTAVIATKNQAIPRQPAYPEFNGRPHNSQNPAVNNLLVPNTKSSVNDSLTLVDNLTVSPIEGEFIPFRRTDVVLSPSQAQDMAPISREPTQVAMAREAYYKNTQPAQYGIHMHNIKDSVPRVRADNHSRDPLYNPEIITKQPTERQQQVLESLRQMRQGLLARQREIEAVVTPTDI